MIRLARLGRMLDYLSFEDVEYQPPARHRATDYEDRSSSGTGAEDNNLRSGGIHCLRELEEGEPRLSPLAADTVSLDQRQQFGGVEFGSEFSRGCRADP